MKTIIAITLALASTSAMADTTARMTELKSATAFTSLGVLGLVAAGPVGMFVGAISGAYISEQFKQADQLGTAELAHTKIEQELLATQLTITQQQGFVPREYSAPENLPLQILFLSGADTLTDQGKQQVLSLARFLAQNPQLSIRLTGHSDPRGTDDYNDILSYQRALTIQLALEQVGIENERVSLSAYGSAYATAQGGTADSYALDRRVDISLIINEQDQVAMTTR